MGDNFIEIKMAGISKNLVTKKLDIFEKRITPKIRSKMIEAIEYVKSKIADSAPSRTGNLKSLIKQLPVSNVRSRGFKLFLGKGTLNVIIRLNRQKDKKILWVDRGTGIYGPRKRRIFPKNSSVLKFEFNGEIIYTRSIRGQKPQKFIERGLNVSKLIAAKKVASAFR